MDRGKQRAWGFTLMELLVTVAVMAVLLTVGVPSMAAMVKSTRELNTYHLLTASLATARISAVRHNTPVVVCPTRDGATCLDEPRWEDGWLIRLEDTTPGGREPVLQHIDGIGAGLALRSTNGRRKVRFTPAGWSYGSNASIRLCTSKAPRLLGKVVVNNAGRARTERLREPAPCPYEP